MDEVQFKIAEAARMVGVSPSTLRLWEAQGLIEPRRTAAGQRLYDEALIDLLRSIVWLRNEEGLNPAAIRQRMATDGISIDAAGATSQDPADRHISALGRKIRQLRQRSEKTLEAVAQATGISASQLSTFERTSQGLSLTSLHTVAKHLGTTIAALAGKGSGTPGESLVRNGEWTTLPPSPSGVIVQVLAEGAGQMECHRFILPPGASSEGAYRHEGEEFIHVLAGSMELVLDEDRFIWLNSGDSFYFESRRTHSWRNTAEGETVLMWINTPASF